MYNRRMSLFSSPPQPRFDSGQLLAAVAFAILSVVAFFYCDLPVAQWFKGADLPGDVRRLINVAEVFGLGTSVICIIATAAVLDRRGVRFGGWLAAHALGAGLLADILKLILARQRPRGGELPGNVAETLGTWFPLVNQAEGYGSNWQSMPSGHTATAFGLASALAIAYPRGRWLFFGFAVLAATQRLQSHAHFLSDVLAAAALGLTWSLILERIPRVVALRNESTMALRGRRDGQSKQRQPGSSRNGERETLVANNPQSTASEGHRTDAVAE